MTSRIKLPFKLGDSKKNNDYEVNELSKKEDFSLSEVRRNYSRGSVFCSINQSIRLFDMDSPIGRLHWPMIPYKKFSPSEQKQGLLKCKKKKRTFSSRNFFDIFSYGGAFVECSLPHPTEVEIVQLVFRVNEVGIR